MKRRISNSATSRTFASFRESVSPAPSSRTSTVPWKEGVARQRDHDVYRWITLWNRVSEDVSKRSTATEIRNGKIAMPG